MSDAPGTGVPDICPWCSSDRGPDANGRCMSCGAVLISDETDAPVPGLTDVDTLGIIKNARSRQPNRIVSWVTGDPGDSPEWAPAGEALEQPTLEVRREMLSLEYAAAIAAQQAEVDAIRADEALEEAERAARQASRGGSPATDDAATDDADADHAPTDDADADHAPTLDTATDAAHPEDSVPSEPDGVPTTDDATSGADGGPDDDRI